MKIFRKLPTQLYRYYRWVYYNQQQANDFFEYEKCVHKNQLVIPEVELYIISIRIIDQIE